jgi:hypothetical protein
MYWRPFSIVSDVPFRAYHLTVHATRAAFQPASNNCCGPYKELDTHDLDFDLF